MNDAKNAVTVTLEDLPRYAAAESPSTCTGEGCEPEREELPDEDVERLAGMWADDTANYLTDMKHPVVRDEWTVWCIEMGLRPDAAVSLRERRQFDRLMVAKYRKLCPPPPRTKWMLIAYDIMDQQEQRQRRQETAARRTVCEEEYVDEEI